MLVRIVTAALVNRRTAAILAASGFAGVSAAFVLAESPGLGIGNFYYLPVCLVALATDAVGGALAGMFAAGLFALVTVVDPRIPSQDALASGTGIRAITFALVGGVVGLYAARNRALVERLHDHATRDFVTGVANVRAFDDELRRRFDEQRLFTLVLVDIDELRRVNEVHGHREGDAALRRVAAALARTAGPDDLVARVGGDEFAFVTMLRPDALPDLVARLNAQLDGLAVTAAGLASTDAETADDLFKKADDRLFAAKLVRPNRRTLAAV
jgi:diguanylate cyclase (GGDEF)-like protein